MSREPLDIASAERAARFAVLRAALGTAAPTASSTVAQERAVSLGEPTLDRALGNLPTVAVHEVVPESRCDVAAATGFLLALVLALKRNGEAGTRPILWVTRRSGLYEAGALSGRGLVECGIDPSHFLLAAGHRDTDVLWALEEAARSGAVAPAVGEVASADLKATQRLAFAARAHGVPILLLRSARGLGPSVARSRWGIAAAPSIPPRLGPYAPGRVCWRVTLEKGWRERPQSWLLEWDDATHSLRLATALADHPVVADTAKEGRATTRRHG